MNVFDNAIDLSDIPREEWRTKYIGPGYRSCCSVTVKENIDPDNPRFNRTKTGQLRPITTKNTYIVLFGYDLNGNPQKFVCPHRPHIKYNVGYPTNELDIYGNYVETRYFDTAKERREALDDHSFSNVIECFRPESEFLHEMFDDVTLDTSFNKQPLRTFYIDIETEMGQLFEYPKTAGQRINMITVYDTKTEKYYTWSLEHAEIDFTEDPLKDFPKDKFVFFEFGNKESNLLMNFLNWWERNYPDVVCGYNSQAFDLPYIVRRIENVLGENEAKRISPIGRYTIKENNLENERANKQAEILVQIDGIFSADELVLFRDKFKVISPLDGGYSLDNVGEALGLGQKIHYEGSLKDLYENNWQKFYEYNVRDVDLLRKVEEKCKLIPLARQVTSSGLCNYETIYSSISYLIGSLAMFSKTKMGKTMVSYKEKEDEKTDKYEGAYVFEPIPGVYRGGIATVDFNSLYPNTIRSINISPETNIGHLSDNWFAFTDDEHPEMSEVNEFTMKVKNPKLLKKIVQMQIRKYASELGIDLNDKEALKRLLIEKNLVHRFDKSIRITRDQIQGLIDTFCIITRNNDILVKHEITKGVVSEWCGFFFNKRKATKKEMAGLEKKLYNKEITDESEIACTEERIQNLNDTQQAIKIMINSIYGCLGTKFSPIFDADLAQSITRQGKFCNRNAARYMKNKFITEFNVDSKYIPISSGDTDSIFINVKCWSEDYAKKNGLKNKDIAFWDPEDKLKFWDVVENFVDTELTPWVRDMVTRECHTNNAEVLRYALEYIADVGIYQAKKNYAVHKVVLEGRELADKIVYKGIELKKGNLPVEVKEILAPIYRNTLTTDYSESDFRKYLCEAYDKFCTYSVDQIAFWKGYNTERKSSGFLEMEKVVADDGHTIGTTSVSAAGTYYNQLLEKLGIGDRYPSIILGDKIRFVYVKCRKYPIKYIAYKDRFPTEFLDFMQIDYETMFEKTVLKPLERYFLATGFQNVDPRCQIADSIDDI